MKAILAMAAMLVLSAPVSASVECGPDLPADAWGASCDLLNIKGDSAANPTRYQANGECSVFHGAQGSWGQPPPNQCKVKWVAEGAYDQTTKAAWETITVGPRQRPYGRYTASGNCGEDPWISRRLVYCFPKPGPNTGNAILERHLTPFFTAERGRQALLAEKDRVLTATRAHPGTSFKDTAPPTPRMNARASLKDQPTVPPRIISPAPGSTHKPLTALNIRIAPPKIYEPANFKVKTYELYWETKQSDGSWRLSTTTLVPAAEAEGPGYLGWGAQQPGTPGLTTATIGVWRVRAIIKEPVSPNSVSEFVEFTIAGAAPGAGLEHVRQPVGQYQSGVQDVPVQGVAGSKAPKLRPPITTASAVTSPSASAPGAAPLAPDNAALNPRALPPKVSSAPAKSPTVPTAAAPIDDRTLRLSTPTSKNLDAPKPANPEIVSPAPGGQATQGQLRVQVRTAGLKASGDAEVEFSWEAARRLAPAGTAFSATAAPSSPIVWKTSMAELARGAVVPAAVSPTQSGQWVVRVRSIGSQPGDWSTPVSFQFTVLNKRETREQAARGGINPDAAALNPQPLPPKSWSAQPEATRTRDWKQAPSTLNR